MHSEPLPNYIKMFRRRTGLSQNEVAALLGAKDGRNFSTYERGLHVPKLETILALEVIFDAKAAAIFAGLAFAAERLTKRQAAAVLERLGDDANNPALALKVASLRRIAGKVDNQQCSTKNV